MSANVSPNRIGPFPFPKSEPKQRIKDFREIEQPYSEDEAKREASRCLLCGTPVCMDACPVQMDVRGMCEAVSRGDFSLAHKRIRSTNALIGVTARCCPQLQGLCEDACVMRWNGQPISIGMIQRSVSDWEEKNPQPAPECLSSSGKSVAIIGAGPAGLAAAELLKRYGHDALIIDELAIEGGTAWYGIPDYHLPKNVLLSEVQEIKKLGVTAELGKTVGKDISLSDLLQDHDAVLITTGCKDPVRLDTPGINLPGIYNGYEFLETVYVNGTADYLKNPKYNLGDEILVIGGGDSALDAARTALRLSQGNVTVIYRRGENEMPADPIMHDEAKEEGIKFRFLTNPKSYNGTNKVETCTMFSMKLSEPDSTGRRTPVPIEGSEFDVKCTSVILTVGRGPNSFLQSKEKSLATGKKNSIAIDDHFRTSMSGVFAAGDVTTGETLVVKAMGSGRQAAQRIHEFLENIDDTKHVSLYERYFVERSVEKMYAESSGQNVKEELPP